MLAVTAVDAAAAPIGTSITDVLLPVLCHCNSFIQWIVVAARAGIIHLLSLVELVSKLVCLFVCLFGVAAVADFCCCCCCGDIAEATAA